jgi:predicted membrane protein
MILYILISFCCFFTFLNFLSTIFLSNFIFRFFTKEKFDQIEFQKKTLNYDQEKGLTDVKEGLTYDSRFTV